MDNISKIQSIISDDPIRRRVLKIVHSLKLPDCWIGAGFVRNAVWDHLHGRVSSPFSTDIDVIWFDAECYTPEEDEALEAILKGLEPSANWSVKNQSRMHIQNGDEPYLCSIDAMRYWPETATAVAARLQGGGLCEIAAPLGVDDLLGLVVRPAGRFATEKKAIFQDRFKSKKWMKMWPLLTLAPVAEN
ncbi:nucleotidyltransferase family protein [Pseudomonas sp. HS6]|uniref:nucleotidyltransferase family protein n=1 Tax=Pseudomonas sp. HS6 TaxID=2850559 RepID=UPI0020198FF9|nr:nucleotidyltransferase family protein [Pseudomonas sp. HS6]UQS16150.1 nucleotidyltransferase family protein [Pseudomonas sp. HS6]